MPRLFVAIDLPEETRDRLVALRDASIKARWTPSEQYHLTLRFIGEVDEATTAQLQEALHAARTAPVRLEGRGLGVFPSQRKPRVLFAALEATPGLLALQERVEAAVQGVGLDGDGRPFTPHITVARLKFGQGYELRRFRKQHADLQIGPFEATSFVLYESRLHPSGAEHRPVATYTL